MSLEALHTWRDLLGDVGQLGEGLRRAMAGDDVVGAVATMFELRKTRAAISRVEAPARLGSGAESVAGALEEVKQRMPAARAAEVAMATWLSRPLPGDARLLSSALGVAVLADVMLPAVWDFETDLVILVGEGLEPVAALLTDLGQRRIVIHDGDRVAGTIATESLEEVALAVRTMSPVAPARFVVRGVLGQTESTLTALTEAVRAGLSDMRIQSNTVRAFSRTWLDQGTKNLPAIAACPSVAALDGAFTGKPMIIVAPGPSLANNIDQLRALDGRAVLACFSHSLKPVIAAGLTPDVVITVDPQDVRYHFTGADLSKTCLVNAATAHPSLFQLGARAYLSCAANALLDDWIFDATAERPHVAGGGSVATSAFSLALRWGCDPIVFVGLDLSFPGGNYYVSSSVDGHARAVTDERGHVRVEGWSDGFRSMKASGGPEAPVERLIELPGWHGGTVPSSFIFSMFHRWFVEKMRSVTDTRVYNCTEGGAFIDGMTHRSLASVLAELTGRVDAVASIDRATAGVGTARRDQFGTYVRELVRSLARVRRHATRAHIAVAAGNFDGLTRAERALAAALAPVPFVSLLAQREIERAHVVAQHDASEAHYLAASAKLFGAVLDVLTVIEPMFASAAKELGHGA
ncbi:MAG TPA: 6-hydroxymethylpterin diphosphokinase MptE-like protein [Kofleriaceae bacterium]|nr:6-hydroxymethylpterin diphosphokinase MptE-like protein [Kofleriaceae bacterium]